MVIRADPVYKYCLNWVKNDSSVQAALGDGLVPGHLRSYRLDAGQMAMCAGTNTRVQWQEPRIQMIFDVTATGPPYRSGIVTCEAVKSGGFPASLHTTLLKVDYETGAVGDKDEGDQTLFLRGSVEDMERVSNRSGLSLGMLGRAVHINQAAATKK